MKTSTQPSSLLLGIILDVSSSMQANWKNKDGREVPQVEAIRDILNKRIFELQKHIRSASAQEDIDDIELFCLGMGFKTIMHTNEKDVSFQKEHNMGPNIQTQEVHHLVCDLLALADIMPGKEKLEEFQEQLNQRWQDYARGILDQSIIREDVEAKLRGYLHLTMYESATKRLHHKLRYKLSQSKRLHRLPAWFSKYLQNYVNNQEYKIGNTSFQAAQRYVNDIVTSTIENFSKKTKRYVMIIRKQLEKFIEEYTSSTLKALTLGFNIPELVDDLDKTTAMNLAAQVQAELELEVKKDITFIMVMHQQRLHVSKHSIEAHLNNRHVRELTERCITKYGWDIIRPLIEETIYTIFEEKFEAQVKQDFPYWIQLASMREVTRPLQQLPHVLPLIEKEHSTTDKIMSGGTPFAQALDKAAIRFIDPKYATREKILIIISDGDFLQSFFVKQTAKLLRRRGVTIISCVVANHDLRTRFQKQQPRKWPNGALQMLDIASDQEEDHPFPNTQIKLVDEKDCVQINHSSIMNDLLATILD